MEKHEQKSSTIIMSVDPEKTGKRIYLTIGILAFLLPTILMIITTNPREFQHSISHYYFTSSRDIFVGILIAIGLMMLCYSTINANVCYKKLERILAIIGGICALSIALFPANPVGYKPQAVSVPVEINVEKDKLSKDLDQYTLHNAYDKTNDCIHTGAAVVLFFTLALFNLFVFSKDSNFKYLYILLGVFIILGMLLCKIYSMLYGEVICLYVFGFSWFLKGIEDHILKK